MLLIWLPVFLSYRLRNTLSAVSGQPNSPNPSLSPGTLRLRPRLFRLIVKSHFPVKKTGYEPGDCVLLVMAFGLSIIGPGS